MVLNLTNGYVSRPSVNMNYTGCMSPSSSSVDSSDTHTNSPSDSQFSPGQIMYNEMQCMSMDENIFINPLTPYLEIIEQPTDKFRFRYKSEMTGTHGTLTGQNSDKIRKATYPTAKLHNYSGPAIIRCALYQIDNLDPHPHRLVTRDARETEKDDPHDICVSQDSDYTAVFHGMGIIHTAKKNLQIELYKKLKRNALENLSKQGYDRPLNKQEELELKEKTIAGIKNIKLNTVRLGFEAYDGNDIYRKICGPVFSHGINNLKSALTGELKIVRMDLVTTSCAGGQEIYMLVEKVVKNNIKIKFYELDKNDQEIWSDYGKFSQMDVHHQYAIVFKAPPYKTQDIEDTVQVFVELERPSDGARSEPRTFKYKPSDRLGRKRPRMNQYSTNNSSFSSGDLPATINNISFNSLNLTSNEDSNIFDSDFFNKVANFHSEEFNKLSAYILPTYQEFCEPQMEAILSHSYNTTDGPAVPSTSSSESRSKSYLDKYNYALAKKVVQELGTSVKNRTNPDEMENITSKLFNDLRTSEGNNALHTSILCEQFDELQYMLVLLSKMKHLNLIDIENNIGNTCLHLANQINNPTVVNLLLSVGANPCAVNKKGNTPLHYAIQENKLDISKMLINKDNVNKENYAGDTPLFIAIQEKNLECVKLLVKHNADINYKHRMNGNTCLHFAIQEQAVDIVSYLLQVSNINIHEDNFQGFTPIDFVQNHIKENPTKKMVEIQQLLEKSVFDKGFFGLTIKEEPEDNSSVDEEMEIKTEPVSDDEEDPLLAVTEQYRPQLINSCKEIPSLLINELAVELDGTETLIQLCKDLEFPFMQGPKVTTKMLLNYTNFNAIPVIEIRDLLVKYGVKKAIKKINILLKVHCHGMIQ